MLHGQQNIKSSNNSLRRWQKALAAFCQAVSSVATVRLTWTKTWLFTKLPAEGRLPKLVQRANPVTGCWMLGWRMKNVLVRRKWFGTEQEVQTETTTNLTRHYRRFGRHSSRKPQAPQPTANSQSAPTAHIRTSFRSLSLTVGSQKLYHWVAISGGTFVRTVLNVVQVIQTFKNEQRKLWFYIFNVRSTFFSNCCYLTENTQYPLQIRNA